MSLASTSIEAALALDNSAAPVHFALDRNTILAMPSRGSREITRNLPLSFAIENGLQA